jgi:hypothetical protein
MPASLLLFLALVAAPFSQALLTLEVRAFSGVEDVTDKSRIIVHAAGRREQAVGQIAGPAHTMKVAPGIYDAQAVHEQAGRVVSIRWAERLVVMPYPDEAGHHLEVINLQPGFGALQVRNASGAAPEAKVALFRAGERSRPAAAAVPPAGPYALFVVRAGIYDVQVTRGTRVAWHAGVDVPLDRTRLWIVP